MPSGPVSNNSKSVHAGTGLNDQSGKGSVNLKSAARTTLKQGSQAIRQVTQQLTKNPNNAPAPKRAAPPPTQTQTRQTQRQNQSNQPQTQRQQTNQPENRSSTNRSENQTPTRQTTPTNNANEPKNNSFSRSNDFGQQQQQTVFESNNRGSQNNYQSNSNNLLTQSTVLIRSTLNRVFQQTDLHLNTNTVNSLTTGKPPAAPNTNQTGNQSQINNNSNSTNQISLPPEAARIVQNVKTNLTVLLGSSQQTNNQMVLQTVTEVSTQLSREIQTVRNFLLSNPAFDVKVFAELNIDERMSTAIETLLQILPEAVLEDLPAHSVEEILNGLLLARGVIVPQDNPAEIINILNLPANKSEIPINFSMTDLRDLGRLVKILIVDAGAAKSFGNLDLAVQKFLKILSANNKFEVLMATIQIANQPQNGSLSRSLAIVQIYDLINRLLEDGEKAMKQTMSDNAAKTVLQKDAKGNFLSVAVREKAEKTINLKNNGVQGAESSLRQFLEFNPNMMHDKSVSAFINPDDARNAQKDFSNLFQREIDEWLRGGNHRFVKDYDLQKPIGIIVERQREGTFSATQMRLVLVRDGSIEGWHFLKSFLVR